MHKYLGLADVKLVFFLTGTSISYFQYGLVYELNLIL